MKRVLKTIQIAPLKVLFVLTLAFAILIGMTVSSETTDGVAHAADANTTKTYLAYELAKSTKATSDGLLTVDRDRAMADDYEKDLAWDFSYVSTQKTLTFTFTPDGGKDVAFYEVTVPKMVATESSTRLTVTVTCGSKSVTGTLVDGTGDNEGTCSMNSFSIPGLSTNPVVANKVTVTVTRISGEFRAIFSESFKFVYGPAPVPVSISAGTGVKSVYLSTSSTATSGSASGTKYSGGTTVYGFAELAKGYKAKSGWTKVSGTADTEGAKYRIGSKTVSSAQNFGTISADLNTYSIGYTLNGGTVSGTNPTSYNVTTNTFTLKNPTRTGYTFTGWTGSNGSAPQKSVSISKGTIGNKTYTANWTANKYNITYKDGGDKAFSGAHENGYPTTHTYGTETALKSASKTGYTFGGWYTNSNCTGAAVTSLGATAYTADITLYAKWTTNSYAVTLDDNGSSGGQGSVTATFDSYIEPLAQLPTKTGYTFAGYYDVQNEPGAASPSGTRYISETGSSTKVWDKASDTTLYAYYTKDMTVSATGYEADYDAGAHTITVTVTDPANGYFILYYDTEKSVSTSDNPQKNNVGSYTVEFYVNKDGYTQYHGSATIVINEVDKTSLTSPLESVDAYYDLIKDKYTTIANTLKDVIDNVKNNIRDNANVTAEQVAQAVADLQTALSTAKVDVTEAKIDAIGSGYYSSEKASAIQDARNYYDDELTDGEKAAVSNYQKLLDAEALYGPVGEVVTEINALGEITDQQVLKTSIETARDHYNALNQDQKDVFPVEILKVLTDNEAIIEVVDEINALGAPENTDAFRGAVTSARGSYNSLTNDQKDIFPAAVLKLLTDDEAAIDVMDLINAIGTVEYTDACKGKIDAANTAYDLLDDAQKTLVANYGVLEQANTDYNKVDEVHDLITLLDPFEYSEDYADALDNARNAYNALTSFQKSILPAEDLKELVDDEKAFDAMAKIDAIGTVTATDVCKDGIDTARGAYNALTDDQKAKVGNYKDLTDAEAAYAVAVKIDAIDEIVTLDSKDGIDEARGAYNELTDDQKARVGNYEYLTDAEAAYAVAVNIDAIDEIILLDSKDGIDTARNAYNALTDDQKARVGNYEYLTDAEAAYAVVVKVDAIDEIVTLDSKEGIDTARDAYNALTDDQKARVGNYKYLTDAEAALAVVDLIAGIDEVILPDDKDAIEAARNAYDALTDDQKARVGNYEYLTDAEAALAVVDLIAGIDEAILTDDKDAIEAARKAYDALTDDQKARVGNYKYLTDAEAAYDVVVKIAAIDSLILPDDKDAIADARDSYDKLTDDQKARVGNYKDLTDAEAAYAVAVKIDAIDEIISPDSKYGIDEARGAYNELTDDQKARVGNYKYLTDAEAALAVVNLIAGIDEVILPDDKDAIEAARNAYDALTDDQKARVCNYEYLTDAEAALAVVNLIAGIDKGILPNDKNAIENARKAYNALTDDQKARVGNYKDLTDAEAAYAVAVKVDSIDEIVSLGSKDGIDEARDAYNKLTDDQKARVGNYEYLTDAEAAYAVAVKIAEIDEIVTLDSKEGIDAARDAYNKLTDDQKARVGNYKYLTDAEAALAVVDLIAGIDEAILTDDKDAIENARNAYNALTDDQKARVGNYKDLTDAEAALAVVELIQNIGDVRFTTTSKELIDAARNAYNALTDDQKARVGNEALLLAAEAEYDRQREEHGKSKLEQGKVSISILDGSALIPEDIFLKVEVKTDVKSEHSDEDYLNAIKAFIDQNDKVSAVYDVKLVRIVNGVEEEIQPSDIKEGTIIIVRMEIPKEAKNKDFRILHIHSKDDIEFVEYTMDNENIYVNVDRLSQFAFVNAKDKGLSAGAVTGIVIAGIAVVAVLFFLFFLLKRRKKEEEEKKTESEARAEK